MLEVSHFNPQPQLSLIPLPALLQIMVHFLAATANDNMT